VKPSNILAALRGRLEKMTTIRQILFFIPLAVVLILLLVASFFEVTENRKAPHDPLFERKKKELVRINQSGMLDEKMLKLRVAVANAKTIEELENLLKRA
jgi:hypothetical protein